ncbi:MAG: glycosyltransferase family 4 protein [Candidatus Kerfeldbacteria bacterium CG08_land_8_20_14_0_20_43_14]|uniref:Glycosyltransferase family 4 protein n=1 Tax=Candidatus Kerfeldbacteria bacterium CG08_land_8_20_14_0_20_43_14 TaxID=2014246 RepID=A0A2H0YQE1_9BACT|nr:MAG: glycosyltransferase family 4 protein [Candidatus Kerfeldbacteria bacterium CG08_land_8_20_14_0_20_43_14]
MRIALVHEYLNQLGGAERVLEALHELYPQAPVHTLVHDTRKVGGTFKDWHIQSSIIERLPGGKRFYKWYLLAMPAAIESFNFNGFDVVISDASAFAKGIIVPPGTLHVCYCHTPTRYLWSDAHTYPNEVRAPWLVRKIMPFALNYLRGWDRQAADRVDVFIANSKFVAQRIHKYYRREAEVIYPPVDTDKFEISNEVGNYYVMMGRLRPYKKFDLAIQAFSALNIPLKIIGTGEEEAHLKKIAKPNIEFLGYDVDRKEVLKHAIAFINPQVEDFGIAPIEAMACGRPVIAYRAGGATETVIDGITGIFFDEQIWESLADTVVRFKPNQFDPQKIRAYAKTFDRSVFQSKIEQFVKKSYETFKQTGRI